MVGKIEQDFHLEFQIGNKKSTSNLTDILESDGQFLPATNSAVNPAHTATSPNIPHTIRVDLVPETLHYGASPLTVRLWIEKVNDYFTANSIPNDRRSIEIRKN